MTQDQLGSILGVTRQAIHEWEHDNAPRWAPMIVLAILELSGQLEELANPEQPAYTAQ